MRDPIQLSALGFGCASISGKVGRSQALRAMAGAFDLGVTHFDVARSYGFGQAEYVVGAFIKGGRDKVTIASKFGVVPPKLSLRTKMSIPIARIATKFLPQLKSRLTKRSGELLASRNFDVSYARHCLNQSLAALATDYIDVYLIHEPDNASLINPDDLRFFLEDSVRDGKIRRWGLAYQSPQDFEWAGILGGDVIQFEGNVKTLPTCGAILDDVRQKIVTRPFVGGLANSCGLRTILHDLNLITIVQEIGASLADVSLCLARDLAGQSGTVLCSMFSPEHIKKNVYSMKKFANDPVMDEVVAAIKQTNAYSRNPN